VVLQRVDVQRAAALARQDRASQPQARTRHRYPVADLQTGQFAPAQPGQRQDRHDLAVGARAGSGERVHLGQRKSLPLPPDPAALVEPLVLRRGREADLDVPRRTGRAEHRHAEVGALLVLDVGDVPDAVRGVVQPLALLGWTATGEWPLSIPESTE
jgi:hypothetical protein